MTHSPFVPEGVYPSMRLRVFSPKRSRPYFKAFILFVFEKHTSFCNKKHVWIKDATGSLRV